ncbi:transposase, partial [Facilibium subflavum]|uniref:transposase n=1 Tax=Facilibium subflavum TaxID=2219058 RepID=UPI0013C2D233
GRDRLFTPEVTLWGVLYQVVDDDQPQPAVVARVIAAKLAKSQRPPSANTSAYSQSRSKLSETGLKTLATEVATKLISDTPNSWLWRGKSHVKIVDGTTLSMPDTFENQQKYPQPKSQQAGAGFPIMRAVAIIEYSSGVILDLAMGAYQGKKTGEHALFRQLMEALKTNDVLLGDCYYPSYF